ncbi:hypothetical protein [Endozoicomonas sp. 2B-B]
MKTKSYLFKYWIEHQQRTVQCAIRVNSKTIPEGFEHDPMNEKFSGFIEEMISPQVWTNGDLIEVSRLYDFRDMTAV